MNLSCTICADIVSPNDDLSVTTCGHMFHVRCLATWLDRSSTCPQCRFTCTRATVIKLYLTTALNDTVHDDPAALQHKNDTLKLNMRNLELMNRKLLEDISNSKETQKRARETIKSLEKDLEQKTLLIRTQETLNKELQAMNKRIPQLVDEVRAANATAAMLEAIDNVIKSSVPEVESLLQNQHSLRSLSTMVVVLKREIRSSEQKRHDMRKLMNAAQMELKCSQAHKAKLQEHISSLESDLHKALEDVRNWSENRVASPVVIRAHRQSLAERASTLNHIRDAVGSEAASPTSASGAPKAAADNSPYLRVSSSSVGLAVLPQNRRKRLSRTTVDTDVQASRHSADATTSTASTAAAAGSAPYSIFQRPRIAPSMAVLRDSNRVFNGVGGSDRRDMFGGFKRPCDSPK